MWRNSNRNVATLKSITQGLSFLITFLWLSYFFPPLQSLVVNLRVFSFGFYKILCFVSYFLSNFITWPQTVSRECSFQCSELAPEVYLEKGWGDRDRERKRDTGSQKHDSLTSNERVFSLCRMRGTTAKSSLPRAICLHFVLDSNDFYANTSAKYPLLTKTVITTSDLILSTKLK
jgi:hypothetical protein